MPITISKPTMTGLSYRVEVNKTITINVTGSDVIDEVTVDGLYNTGLRYSVNSGKTTITIKGKPKYIIEAGKITVNAYNSSGTLIPYASGNNGDINISVVKVTPSLTDTKKRIVVKADGTNGTKHEFNKILIPVNNYPDELQVKGPQLGLESTIQLDHIALQGNVYNNNYTTEALVSNAANTSIYSDTWAMEIVNSANPNTPATATVPFDIYTVSQVRPSNFLAVGGFKSIALGWYTQNMPNTHPSWEGYAYNIGSGWVDFTASGSSYNISITGTDIPVMFASKVNGTYYPVLTNSGPLVRTVTSYPKKFSPPTNVSATWTQNGRRLDVWTTVPTTDTEGNALTVTPRYHVITQPYYSYYYTASAHVYFNLPSYSTITSLSIYTDSSSVQYIYADSSTVTVSVTQA